MESFAVGRSDTGKTRRQNQDALFMDSDLGAYVVCDGMGGHAAGEVASRMTVNAVSQRLRKERAMIDRVRRGEIAPQALARALKQVVREACAEVYEAATSRPECAGMGTTLTLLVIAGTHGIMAHVGDTRLYLYRAGELHQLSTDHTIVEQLVKSGVMTEEQGKNSPFAHAITRAIGLQSSVEADTLVLDLVSSDRFLICSDGLTEDVTRDDIVAALNGEFEAIPDDLVDLANDNGGHDNVTVVAVQIDDRRGRAATVRPLDGLDIQVVLDTLATTFPFVGLTLSQRQRIANLCELVTYEPGDDLFRQDEEGASFVVLIDGRVSVIQDGEKVGELLSGESIGAPFLLAKCQAGATVRALETCHALRMDSERFRVFVTRRPWLGVELLARLGRFCTSALMRTRRDPESLHPSERL